MERETIGPDNRVTGQQAQLRSMLDALMGEQGPFESLMRLTRGKTPENLLNTLGPVVQDSTPDAMDDLLGHQGLSGEFGNGIGMMLLAVQGRRERTHDDPAALPAHAEKIRYCWRQKLSKATEYTSRSEVAGDAMKRYGREFRAFIDTHPIPPELHAHISAQLDRYDHAIDAIESFVSAVEQIQNGPQRLAPHTHGRGISS